jgi:branched-chain amino acid transport system substrate-binding protein
MFRTKVILSIVGLLVVASMLVTGCGTAPATGKAPIVIGYVGNVASPGTKPCMDMQRMAIDEINAAGGILGRPVKYVVEDGKGETSLSVAGVQRMVQGNKATIYFVEGRTEIALATKQKSIELYKDFPHIMIANGASGVEVTDSVLKNYDAEKMIFRDFNPEPGHYFWGENIFSWTNPTGPVTPKGLVAKKWAILYENLAWTLIFRNGGPTWGLPTWDQMAKDDFGAEIVYSKPFSARAGMYLPTLDAISKSGADIIFCVSSWFTDTEVLTKQWADSPAKDVQLYLYGGVSQTHDFWQLTGGKALGVLTASYETPITDYNMAVVTKARAKGIPCQMHVLCSYDDIYQIKAAIEAAGGTDDVGKLITSLETTTFATGTLGPVKYEMTKVPGFFHSRVTADPNSPKKPAAANAMLTGQSQVQANGEYVPIYPEKYAQLDKYKTPAQLRAGK